MEFYKKNKKKNIEEPKIEDINYSIYDDIPIDILIDLYIYYLK